MYNVGPRSETEKCALESARARTKNGQGTEGDEVAQRCRDEAKRLWWDLREVKREMSLIVNTSC